MRIAAGDQEALEAQQVQTLPVAIQLHLTALCDTEKETVGADDGEDQADHGHRPVDDPLGPARLIRPRYERCPQAGKSDNHQGGEPQRGNPHQIGAPHLQSRVLRSGAPRIQQRLCAHRQFGRAHLDEQPRPEHLDRLLPRTVGANAAHAPLFGRDDARPRPWKCKKTIPSSGTGIPRPFLSDPGARLLL